jgi:putative SOS response-associated peptidase YedK
MCGRYSITNTTEAYRRLFSFDDLTGLQPRYNLAPTQMAPVIRERDGARHLDMLRWGLLPKWSKDASGGAKMINARSETIAEKPAFRDAFRARRCLVPADGFYEWQARGKTKKPFRIARKDGETFAFAGLWESWVNPTGGPINGPNDNHATVETYTIATVVASTAIAHIHHRMPVILAPEDHHAWLRGNSVQALSLLRPLPDAELQSFEVSPRVGDIRNDDASLMAPCQEREPTLF